ncbi:acyl-CoA synthetase [Actinopolyspora erythraea]|uniref:Acyl-CoA synthetase n=1 Tax=Actinopolyspora erythraea TaxID=414996 RepID=A0A099D7T0_9ACTN|nr:AMP-binding protein [Actinopolyspora erythraea]ASU78326.1 acyl-CoA synthetase [Actinopolyspora erythraea]KGI81981.1 acyl-CoA synthetase [Actinopolyspora erythraea]
MVSHVFTELTPISFLRRSAAVFAERPAVVDGGFRCTYAQFWHRSQQLAGLLAERGVEPGDRVCVLAPNTHLALEAHYGVPMAGGVLVAVNTRLSPREIAYILDHSGASFVLVDSEFVPLLDRAIEGSSSSPAVITSERYDELVAAASPHHVEVTDERELLSINYTSGTTGHPKGVMYHHRGAYLTALGMAFHTKMDTSTRYLWTLPMFHTNGWCFPWTVTAAGGVHHCLRGIDPATIWNALTSDGISHLCAAPTVLAMLADHQDAAVTPHPVRVFTGGAPPWPSLFERLGALGLKVEHVYGLTETFGPAMICDPQPEWETLDPAERAHKLARQGIANVVGDPVRVIDDTGDEVPSDAKSLGEIAIRGNNVMLGYYRDEEATTAVSPDGWFRTGDLAVRHPDGYVQIRDRAKDIIVSGGENISSVEVENVLTAHGEVVEAAVVSVRDDVWGEIPVAFVSRRHGSTVDEHELIEFVRSRLARFKVPKRVVFDELPTTSTGKAQKNLLRQRASSLSGTDSSPR